MYIFCDKTDDDPTQHTGLMDKLLLLQNATTKGERSPRIVSRWTCAPSLEFLSLFVVVCDYSQVTQLLYNDNKQITALLPAQLNRRKEKPTPSNPYNKLSDENKRYHNVDL